ncbi:O-antigen polymerase [Exiguobacterium sp. s161]|uniref:O-antigen polymerase n=1 Tax=Exiguobacterium sp. s161 TaxID=2751191 RepID=UPI001BE9F44F|nr:O-antigen polymerase [Exiguobacterium sp. s161]
MNIRKVLFLVVIAIVYLLLFTITFWSLIGLVVSAIGLYFYFKPRLRNPIKYPTFVVWLGVFIAFSISIYMVDRINEPQKIEAGSSTKETKMLESLKKESKELETSLEDTRLKLKQQQQETKKLKEELAREKDLRLQTVESYQDEADKRSALESKFKEEETKRIAAEEKVNELESSLASIESTEASENLATEEDYEEAPDEEYVEEDVTTDLEFDPYGADRDCGDFSSAQAAQDFYLAAGGPMDDPHDLDRDNDGNACDWN